MCENVFNCIQNDSSKCFYEQLLLEKCEIHEEIPIGEHSYVKYLIEDELHIIGRLMRKSWMLLQMGVTQERANSKESLCEARKIVNQSFYALVQCWKASDDKEVTTEKLMEEIKLFVKFLPDFEVLSQDVQVKLSMGVMDNEGCPVYQFLHCFLDIACYLMVWESLVRIEENAKFLMKNLLVLSRRLFERGGCKKKIGPCQCVEASWTNLYLFCGNTKKTGFFWNCFNELVQQDSSLFCLWMLKNLATLQVFEENHILIETSLKNSSLDDLTEHLLMLQPLQPSKIEVFQIAWEVFSKKLNSSKFGFSNLTALEWFELMHRVVHSPQECSEDFQIFVGLLVKHLQDYSMHWSKIKGRIFSQLGPNKVKDLTEIGLSHVILLFSGLSQVFDEEILKKLIGLLNNCEKKFNTFLWNITCGYMMLRVSKGQTIEPFTKLFCDWLQEAFLPQNTTKYYDLVKNFTKNFSLIIVQSSDLNLYQWQLIDSWFNKYLNVCYYQDLVETIDNFIVILDILEANDDFLKYEEMFKKFVFPSFKQITNQNCPVKTGLVCAKICLLYCNLLNDGLGVFCGDLAQAGVSNNFLETILQDYPQKVVFSSNEEQLIIKTWAKISLLSLEKCENTTKAIVKFDFVPNKIQKVLSETNDDSMICLIEHLGENLDDYLQDIEVINFCQVVFGHLNKPLSNYLNNCEKELIVNRLFTCIALVFLHCAPLLYNSYKSSCPLKELITTLLLPVNVLVGKSLHSFVVNILRKSWISFFESLVTLNTYNDPFLDRTIRDLIIKYLPVFGTTDSPIIKALENPALAKVILEKMSCNYFNQPNEESEANITKACKIVGDFAKSTSSIELFKLIISKTLTGLFELVIFHSGKSTAVQTIKLICQSSLIEEVKEDVVESIVSCTQKHLALRTNGYFQLMSILARFMKDLLKSCLGDIKQCLVNVERLRGVGFDRSLRLHFEKLENLLVKLKF